MTAPAWQTQRVVIGDRSIGCARAGDGEPLILLHGFPTSSYLFHGMLAPLAAHFSVYAVDLMGYGDSEVPPETPIHLAAQAAMLGELAAALEIGPFTLGGHDLGGGIAQIIALEHPDWLRRMVLIDTVLDDNFPISRISLLLAALRVPGIPMLLEHSPLLRWWAGSPLGIQSGVVNKRVMDRVALDAFVYRPFLHSPVGAARFLRVVGAQAENGRITRKIAPRLGDIHTPTLVLWGERDPFFGLNDPQRLMDTLPGAQALKILPGAGHFCPLEVPDLIAEHILAFCGV